jgi:uroporphyrinogen-III synthase
VGQDLDISACDLEGRGILVTRSSRQSAGLCKLIESQGGEAIRFPALEIGHAADRETALVQLCQAYDLVIFISPNAVHYARDLLSAESVQANLFCAVGRATQKAMKTAGYPVDLIPKHRYDSEGVLAIPDLQEMKGKHVLIVRGDGGRPMLGDTLRARGAKVGYAEVYRRKLPEGDCASLLANWRERIDLVTTTSIQVLENLMEMLGESAWQRLKETPLLVISDRMRVAAQQKGFYTILQAEGADDNAIMAAICDWVDRLRQS